MDPLEYGNCTSSDIRDYDNDLTDNDAEDTRARAEAVPGVRVWAFRLEDGVVYRGCGKRSGTSP